jgi:hypothetical protein
MILVGRHRAFNDGLQRTSLTTWYARVHRPRLEVVQQRTSCEDTKADPGEVGPEATRGSSVLSDGSSPACGRNGRPKFFAFERVLGTLIDEIGVQPSMSEALLAADGRRSGAGRGRIFDTGRTRSQIRFIPWRSPSNHPVRVIHVARQQGESELAFFGAALRGLERKLSAVRRPNKLIGRIDQSFHQRRPPKDIQRARFDTV